MMTISATERIILESEIKEKKLTNTSARDGSATTKVKNKDMNKDKKIKETEVRQTKDQGELGSREKIFIGCWNVRTMSEVSKAYQIEDEMNRYKISILGLSETRWNGQGKIRLKGGNTILYSGHTDEEAEKERGVAYMLDKNSTRALLEWEGVTERIIWARFKAKFRNIIIINVYAPTNNYSEEEKDYFYEETQALVIKLKQRYKRDIKFFIGDWNAKVGKNNQGNEKVMGKHGLGEINENGMKLVEFCSMNNLVIGGTLFAHKDIHKATWISPGGKTKNQIDHIIIERKWKNSLQDVRVMRGADAASDHQLVRAKMKISIRANYGQKNMCQKYDINKLKDQGTLQTYQNRLETKMGNLENLENQNVDEIWNKYKNTVKEVAETTIGYRQKVDQPWITTETKQKINERKKIKLKELNENNQEQKNKLKEEYNRINKVIKKSARRDKRQYFEKLATRAEEAGKKQDMKALYETIKTIKGKKYVNPAKLTGTQGQIFTSQGEIRQRWVEYFSEIYKHNVEGEEHILEGRTANEILEIKEDKFTKEEIKSAIISLKNNKASGIDGLTTELIKGHLSLSVEIFYTLINKIWADEKIPTDWTKGIIIKLPKKGKLTNCENWRAITILSVASKILTKAILERIRIPTDKKIRENQAGFRPNRTCVDHINTLRIILEQVNEVGEDVYVNFIDFEKAFDSLNRNAMWKILELYGIPDKYIRIIKMLYNDFTAQIEHEGQLSQEIKIEKGVKQGCVLSPTLFIVVVDWIMRNTEDKKTGINWGLFDKLEDLEFADDICLITSNKKHMQEKTTKLTSTAKKVGLKINTRKTKLLTKYNTNLKKINIEGTELEEVQEICYLGSIVSNEGGTEQDINRRINLARNAFNMLNRIWSSSNFSRKTKLRLFRTNVKSVLLYGSETWKELKKYVNKLQTFHNKCLRVICKIFWPNRITNQELWRLTEEEKIEITIKKRKWKWIGHTLRKPNYSITKQALDYNVTGKRKIGRPKNTWKRTVSRELEQLGITWNEAKRIAKNKTEWRKLVEKMGEVYKEGAQE